MTTQNPHQTPSSRIALVTGGNRGLGRSAVLALAASGTDVVLTYRAGREQAADVVAEVAALGRLAVALPLDTTQPDTFAALAATLRETLGTTWGREGFDVLVNNAGFARSTPLGGTDAATIAELVAVHLTGVVLLTQELVPMLVDGGRVINTSTGLARFTGDFGYSVYASVKGAVEVYTRYLAKELGPRRIAVNTIAPGATGTDFGGGSLRDDEAVRDHLGALTAMGHVGDPDDVGAAVAALAGPGMGWVTGQRVEASGGMNL